MELFETFKSLFGAKFVRTNIVSPLWTFMNLELCYDKNFNEFLPIGDDSNKIQEKVRKTKLKPDESIDRIGKSNFYFKILPLDGNCIKVSLSCDESK